MLRVLAKIMIETHDAMDLSPREVQRLGDHPDRFGMDAAESLLQRVEDRQRGTLADGFSRNDLGPALTAPWLKPGHPHLPARSPIYPLDEGLGG